MSQHTSGNELTLFHFPGACSIVPMVALEEIGIQYSDVLVNLSANEQHGSYKEINPRGKVPALLIDQSLLAENGAILMWLHSTYPEAALFPETFSKLDAAMQLSDLMWASATWHPVVRSVRMPSRLTEGDEAPVRSRGMILITPLINTLERRLTKAPFFYATGWSIFDVYLYWCYTTAEIGGVDISDCPSINRHRSEIEARASFVRARKRETSATAGHGMHDA